MADADHSALTETTYSQINQAEEKHLFEFVTTKKPSSLQEDLNKESHDKRVRRIENARTFTRGVTAYRERTPALSHDACGCDNAPSSRVFVRARPLFEHEAERGEWHCVSSCAGGVAVHEGSERMRNGRGQVKLLRHHEFQEVQRLDSDSDTGIQLQYLVKRACRGQMATLFMYGMTGSGKTYSTNLLFQTAPYDLVASGTVNVISYELVGKRCYDLLQAAGDKREVFLRTGEDGITHVQGASIQAAETVQELEALLREAAQRRETAATGTNATSSRSHAVYQLSTATGGTLTIIDLAGNEGCIETQYHSKEQMKEAAEINASLMALRCCLAARANGSAHVPYRDSVLTRVLRDALTLDSTATAVLCCVSPACSHLERTLVTLRSAVYLTGQPAQKEPIEEEVRDQGVARGGPNTWDADALSAWVREHATHARITLPSGMTGPQVMKLAAARLKGFCGEDMDVAKQLFDALREASKAAAIADREARQALKAGPKPVSSVTFSKRAPVNRLQHVS